MPTEPYNQEDYEIDFLLDKEVNRLALDHALDIRKFEIELYWKRATYFWTFIAATLAGFVAIRAVSESSQATTDLSVLLANLGLVFSFAWYCVNRGSKYWQENWEYHVDMLENRHSGPLYKVFMSRQKPKGFNENVRHILTGPSPFSVSKINQLISIFVTMMWFILLIYSLPEFNKEADINWLYVSLCGLSSIMCVAFFIFGRSYHEGLWHQAKIRSTSINNDA